MLRISNIAISYGRGTELINALNNISLVFDRSEITAVVGKSGSGKTTLLKVIAGYLKPDSGEVIIDGTSIYKLGQDRRMAFCSQKIGYIWQDFRLIDDMTAKQNIMLPALIHRAKVDEEYFVNLTSTLGISNRLRHYPHQLSGGEKQRCAIARALLLKPQIVLADEPTGSLDSSNSALICQLILTANKQYKQTFIIATHDHDVAGIAHRVIEIEDGSLKL